MACCENNSQAHKIAGGRRPINPSAAARHLPCEGRKFLQLTEFHLLPEISPPVGGVPEGRGGLESSLISRSHKNHNIIQ